MEIKIGKGLALEVDLGKLGFASKYGSDQNTEVAHHIVYMGLRNILMDAHANINDNTVVRNVNGHRLNDVEYEAHKKELSLAASQKKLAAMYNGEVRAMSERTRVDPVEGEARRMALIDIQAQVRKMGKKLNTYSNDQYTRQVDKNFSKYMDAAKKVVAMRANAKVEVDLEGLV